MRITQNMLDGALERLARTSKVSIKSNDCYGYSQLMTADGHSLNATLGDTKKDLYYQIQFYLDMKEAENRLKDQKKDIVDKILNNSYIENKWSEEKDID